MGTIRRIAEAKVGRSLPGVLLALAAFGVAYALVGGTELLMWIGLSRATAGTIVTVIVVVGVVVGLGAFAKYAIDW